MAEGSHRARYESPAKPNGDWEVRGGNHDCSGWEGGGAGGWEKAGYWGGVRGVDGGGGRRKLLLLVFLKGSGSFFQLINYCKRPPARTAVVMEFSRLH